MSRFPRRINRQGLAFQHSHDRSYQVILVSKNVKRAIVGLVGGMGLILLLVGAAANVYSTVTGIILMFAYLSIACVLVRYWGLKKKNLSILYTQHYIN
jgi:hypothetical protein